MVIVFLRKFMQDDIPQYFAQMVGQLFIWLRIFLDEPLDEGYGYEYDGWLFVM